MTTEQTLHLVKMANQIAANVDGDSDVERSRLVAAHINKFWAPPMRDKLRARLDAAEVVEALDPVARAALLELGATA